MFQESKETFARMYGPDSALSSNDEAKCVVEGDMKVNGSDDVIAIVGVIQVTGDVTIVGQTTFEARPRCCSPCRQVSGIG